MKTLVINGNRFEGDMELLVAVVDRIIGKPTETHLSAVVEPKPLSMSIPEYRRGRKRYKDRFPRVQSLAIESYRTFRYTADTLSVPDYSLAHKLKSLKDERVVKYGKLIYIHLTLIDELMPWAMEMAS